VTREFDTNVIEQRLKDASLTLLALPGGKPNLGIKVQTYGYVAEPTSDAMPTGGRARLPTPEPAAIDEMDRTLGWLRYISNDTVRRIVSLRAVTKPQTGGSAFSWAKIAEKVGADVRAVRRWHASGLAEIVQHLATLG
jgi:hypothetical protein